MCYSIFQNFLPFWGWTILLCRYRQHFTYPFICWWTLDCFHLLPTMNSAAMNMLVQIPLQDPAFDSFGYIPRSGITGSMAILFLRNFHTVFQSSCTILHSHQQWTRVLISSHSCQHLLFPVFCFCFYSGHSNVCKEVSCAVLICISLMLGDVEHLYLCLLARISSMEKCIFKTFAQFSIELLVLLLLSFKSSLYVLDINQLWDTLF